MTPAYAHPSLTMTVTPEQRARAEAWLQQAYAEDAMGEAEFDWRIGQVIEARNRRELNGAFYGLVSVPLASQAVGLHPAYQPLVRPEVRQQAGRGAAGFAHFSFFFLWLLGPAMVYALSAPGSYARREAAKAFNFQLASGVGFSALAIVLAVAQVPWAGALFALLVLAWFVLTLVGGAKALQGEDWTNPVRRVVRAEVLRER